MKPNKRLEKEISGRHVAIKPRKISAKQNLERKITILSKYISMI